MLRQISFLFVIVTSLQMLPQMQPTLYTTDVESWKDGELFLIITIAVGSCLSVINIQKLSKTFVLLLILNVLFNCCNSDSQISQILRQYLDSYYISSPDLLPYSISLLVTGHFIISVLVRPTSAVILEFQAFTWETLALALTNGGSTSRFVYLDLFPPMVFCLVIRNFSIKKAVSMILCFSTVLTVFIFSSKVSISVPAKPVSRLTWTEYLDTCSSQNTRDMIACQHFSGLDVTWTGHVESVRLQDRTNLAEDLFSFLPQIVRRIANVDCVFGDR